MPRNEPVFVHANGDYVTGGDVNAAVKKCAIDIGLAATHMSTHSLRRGGSQAMAEANLGDEFRKLFCAWVSDTHEIYKNPNPARCSRVAARMWNARDNTGGLRV